LLASGYGKYMHELIGVAIALYDYLGRVKQAGRILREQDEEFFIKVLTS